MSAHEVINSTGLVTSPPTPNRPWNKGMVCLQSIGYKYGTTMYATEVEDLEIWRGSLVLGKFPNSEWLYEFVRANSFDLTSTSANACRLYHCRIHEALRIIREGIHADERGDNPA